MGSASGQDMVVVAGDGVVTLVRRREGRVQRGARHVVDWW